MMFPVFVALLTLVALGASAAENEGNGALPTCTDDGDCLGSPFTQNAVCNTDNNLCECSSGYYLQEYMCVPIKFGTRCDDQDDPDGFCQASIPTSVCDDNYGVCVCPENFAAIFIQDERPICVYSLSGDDCQECISTGGVCYNSDGLQNSPNSCGCPDCIDLNDPDDPLGSGCGYKYAGPGQKCVPGNGENAIHCSNPKTTCEHDGTLDIDYVCVCKADYVQVIDPANPTLYMCADELTPEQDSDCTTCVNNGGVCYSDDSDTTMDGCACPLSTSSTSNLPEDACNVQHATVDCNSESMTFCIHGKDIYDQYIGTVDLMYAEGHLVDENCHLQQTDTGEWCLTVTYEPRTCGLYLADSKHFRSYSLWILFQFDKNAQKSSDVCVYGYCTYDKVAQVATGLVDVATQKMRYSTGMSIKPEVDISLENKFGDDCEEHGTRLDEPVKLILDLVDGKGVYVALRAEICVASNMMSLNHPNAQSAVFILDGCPVTNGLFGNAAPVFLRDPNDSERIISTFFPMPKFNTDIVFFHCAVKVCLTVDECGPPDSCPTTSRRKRDLVKRRIGRSADLVGRLESPDLTQKTLALSVIDPRKENRIAEQPVYLPPADTSADRILNIEERLLEKIEERQLADLADETDPETETMSPVLTAVIAVSCLTVILGLALVVYRVTNSRRDIK